MGNEKQKNTLVLGASNNQERYSYKAVKMLLDHGYKPVPMGVKKGEVLGLSILEPFKNPQTEIHTVSLYLNPKLQEEYYDFVESLAPKRVIFNPGTENNEWAERLSAKNIEAVYACTLVMLTVGNF